MIAAEGPDPVALLMILVRWVLGTQRVPVLDSAARVVAFAILGYVLVRMIRVDLADARRQRRARRAGRGSPGPGGREPGA